MHARQEWKTILATHRKEIVVILPILLSLVLFSFLMRYQGWRSKNLGNWDMLVYSLGAESMVHDGIIIEKGDLSSYHAYQPPGTVYLVLPAILLLKDPRLFSLPGDLLVNIATVVFLYLIFRQAFGRGLALAICVVFGFSRLVFMGIWPIGHPAYVLGMLWFLMQWIRKRSAWWLFGAMVIGAFGLYVDLAILPFLFVFPVLWILFRPPLRPIPILLAFGIGVLIWFPYLRYESSQNFADLKSILLLKPIPGLGGSTAQTPTYCYASLPGEMDSINDTYIPFLGNGQGMDRVVFSDAGWEKFHRLCVVLTNLDRNFDGGFFLSSNPVISASLWFLFLMGMFQSIGMALTHLEERISLLGKLRQLDPKIILGVCLVGSLLIYAVMNPETLAHFSADGTLAPPTRLVAVQLEYYGPLIFSAAILGFLIGFRAPKRDLQDVAPLLVVWIPWLLLVFLAERTRSERFYWIWSLQVAALVFAVFKILEAISKNPWWKRAAVILLAVLVFPLSFYLPSLRGWISNGFSGGDSPQIQVVDYIHHQVETEGKQTTSIGYSLLSTYYGQYQSEDTRMRSGSWFDLIFETRWGIRNLNQSPTGISDGDTWRILEVETVSDSIPSPWEGYTQTTVFGTYIVYKAEDKGTTLKTTPRYFLNPNLAYFHRTIAIYRFD
jgi:hypothetical protein